jgi:murein DD-endopeptidase MepM/ murein hydrolase activator NlpD
MVRLLMALGGFLALLVIASLVMVLTGAFRLSKISYLEHRNHELEAEMAKVVVLRKQLFELEQQTRKMAAMLGVEKTPSPVDWDSVPYDSSALPEWVKGKTWGSQMVPVLLPVEGYAISQRAAGAHEGVDLAAREGTPVRATADAVVEQRGNDRQYGRFILLKHGTGFQSYYGHLEDWNVDKGDTVQAGQTVGWVGSTGRSTAPHLHFEIRRDGLRIDPASILKL